MTLTTTAGGKSLDISKDTSDFRSICTSWASYKEGINDVKIYHVRKCVRQTELMAFELTINSYDLPDDVFQPGETKPARPKKKVVKKIVKRSFEEVEVANPNSSTHDPRRSTLLGPHEIYAFSQDTDTFYSIGPQCEKRCETPGIISYSCSRNCSSSRQLDEPAIVQKQKPLTKHSMLDCLAE